MPDDNRYLVLVEKAILENTMLPIDEVRSLMCVYSSLYEHSYYLAVLTCLKENKLEDLNKLSKPLKEPFGQYLDVYQFLDGQKKVFLATVYDSDELWQDPELLELIECDKGFS